MPRRDSISTTSDSSSNEIAAISPAKRPSARGRHNSLLQRRPTYEARKHETNALRIEVSVLKRQLAQLQLERESVGDRKQRNVELRNLVEQQQLYITSMHTLLGQFVTSHDHVPFHSATHLPCDRSARRAILAPLRDDKLNQATRFIFARQLAVGDRRESRQFDEYIDEITGDNVSLHCEVTHFRGVPSVKMQWCNTCSTVRWTSRP